MRQFVVSVVLALCALELVYANLGDFFEDIGNAIKNTWSSIKSAIKRPVRIKRLGKRGKLKSTLPPSTTAVSAMEVRTRKLRVPVIPRPKWRSVDHWRTMQKPYFAEARFNDSHELEYFEKPISYRGHEKRSARDAGDDENENIFGSLIFI